MNDLSGCGAGSLPEHWGFPICKRWVLTTPLALHSPPRLFRSDTWRPRERQNVVCILNSIQVCNAAGRYFVGFPGASLQSSFLQPTWLLWSPKASVRALGHPWAITALSSPMQDPHPSTLPRGPGAPCSSALSTHWSYTLLPPSWTWCKPRLQTHWENKRAWETKMLASCWVTLPDLFGQGTSQASPLCPGALQRAELWSSLAPAAALFISR